MAIEFVVSVLIPASPQEIYTAWLSSDGHSKMTGGSATMSAEVGGEFDAWDGYIRGRNLELEYGKRIVQSWRTVEFEEDEADFTYRDHPGVVWRSDETLFKTHRTTTPWRAI